MVAERRVWICRGFTLVEVLLWLAALGIVAGASLRYGIGDGAANEAQRLADALNIAARHARAYCAYAGDSPCRLPADACQAHSVLDGLRKKQRDLMEEMEETVGLAERDRLRYRTALKDPLARDQKTGQEVDRTMASFYADRSLPEGWCRVAPSALSLSSADGLPDLLTPLERTVWESSLGGLRAQSSGYCRDDGVCVCAQISNESLRGMVAARVAGRQPNPDEVRQNSFTRGDRLDRPYRLLQDAIGVVDEPADWPSDLVCAELPPSVDREFSGGGSPSTDIVAFPENPFAMTSLGSLEQAWETIEYCHPDCDSPVTRKERILSPPPEGTTHYACTSPLPDKKIEVDLHIPDSGSVLDAKAIDVHFGLSGAITSGQQLERRFVTLCFL